MSKIEYLIWQCDTSLHLVPSLAISQSKQICIAPCVASESEAHKSTNPKWKLRNNIDMIDYFAGDNEMAAVYRYRYRRYFGSQISISYRYRQRGYLSNSNDEFITPEGRK